MLESRANRELCRNCKAPKRLSQIQQTNHDVPSRITGILSPQNTLLETPEQGIFMEMVLERPRQQGDMFATHPDLLELDARNLFQKVGRATLEIAGVVPAEDHTEAIGAARERNAQVLGERAVGQGAEIAEPQKASTFLVSECVERVKNGDTEARKALLTNVRTEIIEMICKGGAVMDVEASMNAQGELEQFGQTTYHRQKNTLTFYPNQSQALKENTLAEGQNGFLIEHLWQQGALADKKVLEFSLILDNDNAESLAKYGYYLHEMIAILRMTDVDTTGKVAITSALVGGVDQDAVRSVGGTGSPEDSERAQHAMALASRFDIAVVREIYEAFGYDDAHTLTTTELLAKPLLVPKEYDVLDFVRLYDETAARITGKNMFFGLSDLAKGKEAQDAAAYREHAAASRHAQAQLEPLAEKVVAELLQRHHSGLDALATSKLIREIAKNQTVTHIITEKPAHIDTRIFGAATEQLILRGQEAWMRGDMTAVQVLTAQAQQKARPSGCATDKSSGDTSDNDDKLPGTISFDGDNSERQRQPSSSEEKSKWDWKNGVCRVPNCPTRPATTKVGPCSVCRGCQRKFDSGRDPVSEYARRKPAKNDTK